MPRALPPTCAVPGEKTSLHESETDRLYLRPVSHKIPPCFICSPFARVLPCRKSGNSHAMGASNRRLFSFSLRSLPLTLAAIPGRIFSSLLPPSFARGRSATYFFPAGAAACSPCPLRCARDDSDAPCRRHRVGHLGAVGCLRVGGARAGVAVRSGRLFRRPHAHRGRDARRPHPRCRHRLSGAQRTHLPAPASPVLRTRRRDRQVGHVVLGAGARRRFGQRARMEWLRPEHRVRAAPQPCSATLLEDARRRAALQPHHDRTGGGRA